MTFPRLAPNSLHVPSIASFKSITSAIIHRHETRPILVPIVSFAMDHEVFEFVFELKTVASWWVVTELPASSLMRRQSISEMLLDSEWERGETDTWLTRG